MKTIPEPGALNHPVHKKIVLYFSEWVDVRNLKKSVTVFPTLRDGFEVTATGRRLEIKPKKRFADSTTYHVGIHTDLTDYHSVSIGTPYNFFFSTGPSIDKAMVYGCVIDAQKKTVQPKVALFRKENGPIPDSAFINLPSYLVQTDSAGHFSFMHLRRGRYSIVAFADNDNNNCLTPGKEDAFTLQNREFLLEEEAGPLLLFPVYTDTTPLEAATIKAISPLHILGEWNQAPQQVNTSRDFGWKVLSLDSLVKAPRILEFIQVSGSKHFALKLGDSLTAGSYSLLYRIYPRMQGFKSDTAEAPQLDTIRFNGTIYADTVQPVFKGAAPAADADLNTTITITWSKPVKPAVNRWFVADTVDDTALVSIDTAFGETTVFTPKKRLLPGRYYTMILPALYFRDLTGNSPAGNVRMPKKQQTQDSTDQKDSVGFIYIKFTTIQPKDLCYSLCGSAPCLAQDSLRIWEFRPLNTEMLYTAADKAGAFCFDSIQGIKGRIGYFVDTDGNGKHTTGSMFPWSQPEPLFVFPDTVEARARWDIEGVTVAACDVCLQPVKQVQTAADTLAADTSKTGKNR